MGGVACFDASLCYFGMCLPFLNGGGRFGPFCFCLGAAAIVFVPVLVDLPSLADSFVRSFVGVFVSILSLTSLVFLLSCQFSLLLFEQFVY